VGFFRKLLGSHMNEKRSWDSSGSVTWRRSGRGILQKAPRQSHEGTMGYMKNHDGQCPGRESKQSPLGQKLHAFSLGSTRPAVSQKLRTCTRMKCSWVPICLWLVENAAMSLKSEEVS
jgi:hypothetical protein